MVRYTDNMTHLSEKHAIVLIQTTAYRTSEKQILCMLRKRVSFSEKNVAVKEK